MGFVSVYTHTWYGYSFCRFRYSVGKSYPQYTHDKSYPPPCNFIYLLLFSIGVHACRATLVHNLTKEIDGTNYIITKWVDEKYFYKKIIVEDEKLEHPLQYTEVVNKFTLKDFTEMFACHGLQIEKVFGDYNFGEYDKNNSTRLIMIARKK